MFVTLLCSRSLCCCSLFLSLVNILLACCLQYLVLMCENCKSAARRAAFQYISVEVLCSQREISNHYPCTITPFSQLAECYSSLPRKLCSGLQLLDSFDFSYSVSPDSISECNFSFFDTALYLLCSISVLQIQNKNIQNNKDYITNITSSLIGYVQSNCSFNKMQNVT